MSSFLSCDGDVSSPSLISGVGGGGGGGVGMVVVTVPLDVLSSGGILCLLLSHMQPHVSHCHHCLYLLLLVTSPPSPREIRPRPYLPCPAMGRCHVTVPCDS